MTSCPGNHDTYVRAAAQLPQRHWGDYMRGDARRKALSVSCAGAAPLALIGLSTVAADARRSLATGRLGARAARAARRAARRSWRARGCSASC